MRGLGELDDVVDASGVEAALGEDLDAGVEELAHRPLAPLSQLTALRRRSELDRTARARLSPAGARRRGVQLAGRRGAAAVRVLGPGHCSQARRTRHACHLSSRCRVRSGTARKQQEGEVH